MSSLGQGSIMLHTNDYIPGIFRTNKGYRDGYILGSDHDELQVLFTHDETGTQISECANVQVADLLEPWRINEGEVEIFINDSQVKGCVKAGCQIDVGLGYGSGVIGKHKSGKPYPIFRPLTLHDEQHAVSLTYASTMLAEAIEKDLELETLKPIYWLINLILVIDGYPSISESVMEEAIRNFIFDYTSYPEGSDIPQPINYVLDVLRIDGVVTPTGVCVSFS